MPLTVRPDLPEGVELAIEIFGNRIRVAILRSLIGTGPATRRELSDRLDIGMASLAKQLAVLEGLEVVYLTPPRSVPGIRPRYYNASSSKAYNALSTLRKAVTESTVA